MSLGYDYEWVSDDDSLYQSGEFTRNMAQAFPSLILDTVLEQLGSPIFQRKRLDCRLRTQLLELQPKLELIREVIVDAELMAILFPDVVCECLRKLQCVLYELDDLLDEALTRWMPAFGGGMVEKARLYFCNMPFHLTLAHKLKSMNGRLECIVKEWHDCNLIIEEEPAGQPQPSTAMGGSRQKPVVRKGILRYDPDRVKDNEFQMIGRDDEKQRVIATLLNENSETTVCIAGDVGAGKTTLCRAVYMDDDVRNRFEVRSWVRLEGADYCHSIIFWKKIIATLVRPAEAHLYLEIEDEDRFRGKFVSLIAGRKTLLVLDSVPFGCRFREYEHNLYSLRNLIADGHKGNKILLSSQMWRNSDFTYISALYELPALPEEHLWSIFENNAFALGHHDKAGQFVAEWKTAKGKQILRRCGGNPALLRGVSTLLYGKDDTPLWEYFACDFDFKSQHHLYAQVDRVCQVFPKSQQPIGYLSLFSGGKIQGRALMNQLAAHRFADSSNMQQLIKFHHLLLTTNSDRWDDEKMYRVAESGQYGILSLTEGETATLGWTEMETDVPEVARHVSIARPSSSTPQTLRSRILPDSLIKDIIHRRSVLFLGGCCPARMSAHTLDTLATNLIYLRVLDLHDLGLTILPSSIVKLIHLKYLDLSRNDFRVLPKSVCVLKNLWTLKLIYCDKLIKLPRHIESLIQLKSLEITMCLDLYHMPSRIARLTSLKSLDRFVICPHKGGLRYLRNLDSLKGKLSIELPRKWENSTTDARDANLERKVGLTTLEFKWQGATIGDEENDDQDVLEKLKPHNKLQSLSIVRFGGMRLSSWITSMDFLTEVIISQCTRCEILPPFHKMPWLKFLTLNSMNIKYFLEENNNNNSGDWPYPVSSTSTVFFPSLQEIRIGGMLNLKGWWSKGMETVGDDLPSFPFLKDLEIWNCPYLTMMPPSSKIFYLSIFQDVSVKMLQSNWGPNRTVVLISIQDMVSLPTQLVIKLPPKLTVKDCNQLQMMWENEVKGAEAWKPLPYHSCFLTDLYISNCPALKNLSGCLRHQNILQTLSISKCSEELDCLYREDEVGMPWKALQMLKFLKIEGFGNLVALPRGIQYLYRLERIDIKDCKALTHLSSSLRHLSNLSSLKISRCNEELDCLYKEDGDEMPWKALQNLMILKIKGFENLVALPKGLRNLHELVELGIIDCKALKWEVGSLPKSKHLIIKSCPQFYKNIDELEREHPGVKLLK